jgi:uncharacterized protein YjbI with pentapeptide repeats
MTKPDGELPNPTERGELPNTTERDYALKEREYTQRDTHHAQTLRAQRRGSKFTFWGVVISATALVVTVIVQFVQLRTSTHQFEQQLRSSAQQFQRNTRRDEYAQIVKGLESPAAAVQASSMRRLNVFVMRRPNFESDGQQQLTFQNALLTISAFIADESTRGHKPGLSYYPNPEPIIVPRAMNELKTLTSMRRLAGYVVDIGGANLHGVSLRDFSPTSHIYAPNTDFRQASLDGMDLTHGQDPSTLSRSFFTCADLTGANLGKAIVSGADFTGANLSGADLSGVKGLSLDQLHGTTIDEEDVPSSVELRWRPGEHQAALMS